MINLTEKSGAVIFGVRVVPRASNSEISGELDGALKVRISAPPVDGAANAELVKVLSKNFKVSKSEVEIVAGHASKTKQVKITNLTAEKFLQLAGLK